VSCFQPDWSRQQRTSLHYTVVVCNASNSSHLTVLVDSTPYYAVLVCTALACTPHFYFILHKTSLCFAVLVYTTQSYFIRTAKLMAHIDGTSEELCFQRDWSRPQSACLQNATLVYTVYTQQHYAALACTAQFNFILRSVSLLSTSFHYTLLCHTTQITRQQLSSLHYTVLVCNTSNSLHLTVLVDSTQYYTVLVCPARSCTPHFHYELTGTV